MIGGLYLFRVGEESPKGRRGINIPSRDVKFIQLEFRPHPGRRGYNTPMSGEEKVHRISYSAYFFHTENTPKIKQEREKR